MKTEKWVKWEPVENLAKVHFIEIVKDGMSSLVITFFEDRNQNKTFQLIFDETVIAYRNVDEGYRLTIYDKCIQDDGKDLYGNWTFFKAINSDYMQWLKEQTNMAFDFELSTHFVIYTVNAVVDVVAISEPIIKYLK